MSEATRTSGATRRRLASLGVAVFLAFQLLLPLRGCLGDEYDAPVQFSWAMYTESYHCQASYLATYADGSLVEVDPSYFFNRRSQGRLLFFGNRLPALHEHLCAELQESGELVSLEGICYCSHNQDEDQPMVRDDVNLCTAPNYGVLER